MHDDTFSPGPPDDGGSIRIEARTEYRRALGASGGAGERPGSSAQACSGNKDAPGAQARPLRIRRALLSVSEKSGVIELACALSRAGAELVATGRTAKVLTEAGLTITPIEQVSGSPEAFQGRMKTLSFPVCGGILYRRGDRSDETDLERLRIAPIDCVVVNFYPFEAAARKPGISRAELIEEIDIGGPTLVRAAAKNAPDVLVLTDPLQYPEVIAELEGSGAVSSVVATRCASEAWDRILRYDVAIGKWLGTGKALVAATESSQGDKPGARLARFESFEWAEERPLRYGENPHQKGTLEHDPNGPIDWSARLSPAELSYNNILDLTSAYGLASDLLEIDPDSTGVVIVKHNNPCGVAMVPKASKGASGSLARVQLEALTRAWEGDPVSAFGGILIFTDPLQADSANFLADRFVECVAAPKLDGSPVLDTVLARRKNLKAVSIRRFGEMPVTTVALVPGGRLLQSSDHGIDEPLRTVTRTPWPAGRDRLARFGIAVTRALKSNAIALVREIPDQPGACQLVGAGQGQPNRVDALRILAVPRAHAITPDLGDCVMVSDAFFPFRDTVDAAAEAGIRAIVQPGGSVRDTESIVACDERGVAMVFTGVRHFRH